MNNNEKVYLARFLFPEAALHGKGISGLLQMAVSAERICRLKYCEGEHNQDLCLQVHKERTIISSIDDEDSFGYELTEPAKVKRACYYLFDCAEQTEAKLDDTDIPALQMSKSRFNELKDKAATSTLYFLAECLTEETGDLVRSAQLARALKYRTADGELRLCSRGTDSWTFQHAGYIGDTSGGWLLRMSCESAEDWIIAVPASKADVCYALYEWMLHSSEVANPE
ncbi:hypothetical protein R70723_18435 [Paenibacillus sp. FSL R7-0273]|uniref:hypothetical protein n=1 Tax=Paenibacillus sp. FSL R7-0273 TaxID=1536772 RepID=UPI0004F929C1|nr:hypothetical protein [Paenibacillus sp. FSL R7-0273]AIQ47649.1 hypothetical protein R70723_18435 [Paenibacillus sp. FSL R7-0273]OMF95793.1 hypothetical protein BK144_04185 [Paenibacillus sp. FSL R7-0273]